jgi:hypothetical protein
VWKIISESTQPSDRQSDLELLLELNRNYVRSVDQADTQWFDEHLADDFMNTNPDGTLIDRSRFLTQIARGSTVKNIREFDVLVRVLGTFAIIHAKTRYLRPDGTEGQGCYTDDWQFRGDRWLCVSAHVSRL